MKKGYYLVCRRKDEGIGRRRDIIWFCRRRDRQGKGHYLVLQEKG